MLALRNQTSVQNATAVELASRERQIAATDALIELVAQRFECVDARVKHRAPAFHDGADRLAVHDDTLRELAAQALAIYRAPTISRCRT